MQWLIRDDNTGKFLDGFFFKDLWEARGFIDRMGPAFGEVYKPICETGNSTFNRMINEGLVQNDLQGILLPLVSIDEYVPGDAETDNIVLAFFVKGVPEAVLPFKNFCEKTKGVVSADYGDSDTIPSTSIVYVEMERENIEMEDIRDLMIQVGMISGLEPDDFTMTFPHTGDKFPYDLKLMATYFRSRDERENKLAQRKAERKAEKLAQREVERFQQQEEEPQQQEDPHASAQELGIPSEGGEGQEQSAQNLGIPTEGGEAQPVQPAQAAQATQSAQELGIPTAESRELSDYLARLL